MPDNPLLRPSTLAYDLPPFALIRDEHYLPAYEQGMAEQLAEVAAIAEQPDEPTFVNTIEALERSGQLLDRARQVFTNMTASNSNDTLQAIEAEVSPRYAAHRDAILLNTKLFARVRRSGGWSTGTTATSCGQGRHFRSRSRRGWPS